ncbi:MAG: alkaline phosphatase [Lentisphaerae bacterium]|nr:alkaline phosphatase [Lentisphaerota bacterium]
MTIGSPGIRPGMRMAAIGIGALLAALAPAAPESKNVIVLIPDGMGPAGTTLLRWYRGAKAGTGAKERLNLDRMDLRAVRTYGAGALVTDSAAAATAFACGRKTACAFVGVLPGGDGAPPGERVTIPGLDPVPDELAYSPVASVLEAARLGGRKVGLVATANVQHATPAGYSAHTHSRGQYERIAEQQVYGRIDVVLGGGARYVDARRRDGENLLPALKAMGYTCVSNRAEMAAARGPRLWGMFADEAMACEFDRRSLHPDQPSLAEMTRKAVEILSRDGSGFFLLVEGSKVDWANHGNDPIGLISELGAFDDAVGVALDFAEGRGDTAVFAFTDHGCGGMVLLDAGGDAPRWRSPLEALAGPLLPAKLTAEGVTESTDPSRGPAALRDALARHYGLSDLAPEETAGPAASLAGQILSSRAGIGWMTTGHTGEDVLLYTRGIEGPRGLVENTAIAQMCADALGVDLAATTARLYAEALPALRETGATVFVDAATDPANKALVARKGATTVRFPLDKNLLVVSSPRVSGTYAMEGLTVEAEPTRKIYAPRRAMTAAAVLLQ